MDTLINSIGFGVHAYHAGGSRAAPTFNMPRILSRIAATCALALLLAACGEAHDPDKRYFACDFRGSPHKKTANPNPRFDRAFYYKPLEGGAYAENFQGDSRAGRRQGDAIYRAILKRAGERQGAYREELEVYRFHLDTHVMTHSYVFHVTPADYQRHFQRDHPHSISSYVDITHQPYLFSLVARAIPDGAMRVGWDKSIWQCRPVSAAEYARQEGLGAVLRHLSD